MTSSILSRLKGDKIIWLVIFLISLISLLSVYTGVGSPAMKVHGSTTYHLIRHTFLLGLGLLVTFLVHKMDYRIFAKYSKILLFITIPVLAYTIFFGTEINEARRWIRIFGLSFQPSDLGKVTLLIYLAKELTEKQDVIKDFSKAFLPTVGVITLIAVLIAPSNLSTAAVIFMTGIMLMFIAGVDLKYIGGLAAVGVLAAVILFNVADRAGTWQSRWDSYVASWVDPNYMPDYQQVQAYAAFSAGGTFGLGAGKSSQRNFVPNSTSDNIYPIIAEEHGVVGAVIVLLLYLTLLFRAVGIVTMSKTFGALLAAGLSFMLVMQAMINMAVAVGVVPVTGLPMPMLSMGGTSLLFTGVALGIILSVSRTALEERAKAGKGVKEKG